MVSIGIELGLLIPLKVWFKVTVRIRLGLGLGLGTGFA
jgi:hypothetical protein